MGEQFAKIINRGTPIPTQKTKRFTTDTDDVTSVDIHVYQGERKLSKDNYKIGTFKLTGIDPCPRGVPQITITIEIDYNENINITAVDKRKMETKKTLRITDDKGRLSKIQIEQMIKEAREMEMNDRVNSEKRRFKFEIHEMRKTILENMIDPAFKLKDIDKKNIS